LRAEHQGQVGSEFSLIEDLKLHPSFAMQQKCHYIEIPVQVIAHLKSLSGEEFKMVGAFCYLRSNGQKSSVLLEQIQKFSGIPESQIKPTIYRLIRRGWLLESGNNSYQMVFNSADLATSSPTTISPQLPTNYDPSLGIRPPRVKVHLLYPEGPWLADGGLLDEAFVRDRAAVWRTGNHYSAQSYGAMAIEDVMGAICKHYAKPENHGNLEIDWHSYCSKNQRYLSNVQQRLRSGVAIQADEQEIALKKLYLAAKKADAPYELVSDSTELPTLLSDISLGENIQVLPVSQPKTSLPTAMYPEPPEPNDDTSPIYDNPLSEANLSKLIRSVPKVEPVRPLNLSRVEKLKVWLADPILREEAAREAQNSGYELIYDDYGVPVDIVVELEADDDENDDF
jgi:hypothetical protein